MRWTSNDIAQLEKRGMVASRKVVIKKIPKEEPKPLQEMKQILKYMGVEYETEYHFLEGRKFRFDIYLEIKNFRIGVEYDGIFSKKSRHTSVTGFSKDTEKTNLAQLNGFIVLRYTAMTAKNFIHDINFLLKKSA